MLSCLINGIPHDQLNSDHRMVSFGDGLFETCLAELEGIRFWGDHIERLESGLIRLGMAWDSTQREALEAEIRSLLEPLGSPAVCKLILGRQVTGRGYDFDPTLQSTDRVIQLFPYQSQPWHHQGADLVISEIHASANASLAGLKHLNRLDSVLARQSARQAGAHEALMLLADGRVVEGSMSNVYLKLSGRWLTPDLAEAGVNGIIRRRLLRQQKVPVSIADIYLKDVQQAEAMMISNSLIGLVPVVAVNARPLAPPAWDELSLLRTAIGLLSD